VKIKIHSDKLRLGGVASGLLGAACHAAEWLSQPLGFESPTFRTSLGTIDLLAADLRLTKALLDLK